jgi:hypothetical protein
VSRSTYRQIRWQTLNGSYSYNEFMLRLRLLTDDGPLGTQDSSLANRNDNRVSGIQLAM